MIIRYTAIDKNGEKYGFINKPETREDKGIWDSTSSNQFLDTVNMENRDWKETLVKISNAELVALAHQRHEDTIANADEQLQRELREIHEDY